MLGDLGPRSTLHTAWPLVGRDRELEAIASARADPGCHGVVVVAAAGIGKSRLAREAQAAADRDGAFVGWIQATRSAAAMPLAAVADLVPDEVRSDDVVALLRRCGEELHARAGGRPVVLAVDDAQLLDPASAALILHLASYGSAFILATVRAGEPCPDAIVSLWKDDTAPRLELGELSDEGVRALVETALGDPVEEEALDWVTDVSQGNALYVRELVRGALDAGALVHAPGFWRLEGRPTASSSLLDLVAQRMDGLTTDHRRAVELLALGEPLALDEIEALTSEDTLVEAESYGLIATSGDGVRLAHPLYGETVRATLPPIRARSLRLALVDVVEARVAFGPDDALRAARLRLDAGVALSAGLALDAARAANRAGDPDLGAELASLAGAGGDLAAAMLLAQSHTMRNRHEQAEAALAAVEPFAPGDPNARDYLRQRLWLYHWGLRRRTAEIGALLDRAHAWSEDPSWDGFTARIRGTYTALADGFGTPPDAAERAGELAAPDQSRRSIAVMQTMALFLAGQGDATAATAFAARPSVPLRDDGDAAALGVLSLIAVESGYRWYELEQYMSAVVRDAVHARDHAAAGLSAFTLARLHFLKARYRDAVRWLAEAEVHLHQQDPFNVTLSVRALQVGVASFTGEFDATLTALERLHAWCEGHPPLPAQRVPLRRAEGWALRMRNAAEAGRQLLEDAASLEEMVGLAPQLAYDALRAGAPAAPALERMAARNDSRLVNAYARHGSAKTAHDGTALMEVAEEMAAIGALRYAVEAASDAATAYLSAGRQDSARRAAARARELHVPDQGAELPEIDGLEATAIDLTPREAQLIGLARQSLSNAEIADRLVISVRTVETHLYRGMQKLGVNDRHDL
jgi:DNA-binding CsgD family transcriptional regulator